ncbi:MAG: S41 family peptidase [Pyrinomonadaceae bacterium]
MTIHHRLSSVCLLTLALSVAIPVSAQYEKITSDKLSNVKAIRKIGTETLDKIEIEIKERYYDKTFHGVNLDARFKEASDKIKQAETRGQIYRITAQLLTEFDDSHLFFIPLNRANAVDYGFNFQMIGNQCMVTSVKKGSDAEAQGLKAGDIITGISSYNPTRENIWKLQYVLYTLDPQASLKIYVANKDGTEKELQINSKFRMFDDIEKERRKKNEKDEPARCVELDSMTVACRLETFEIEPDAVKKMMKFVGNHPNMILDLRGNRGGSVEIEELLVSYFFDKDVKIGDFVSRGKTDERIAKTHRNSTYTGKLSVLIDSESASAAEVFARVIQIEKRGTIIGDISSGAVMTSVEIEIRGDYERNADESTSSFSGLSVTVGDLIMSDGKRLEKVGVIPDMPARPAPAAFRDRLDVVLAYAAKQLGGTITAADAGKLHFIFRAEDAGDSTASKKAKS